MTQRWEVHHGTTWAADSAKAVIRGRLGEEHARGKLSACYKLWQCRADCSVIVTDQTEVVPKNFPISVQQSLGGRSTVPESPEGETWRSSAPLIAPRKLSKPESVEDMSSACEQSCKANSFPFRLRWHFSYLFISFHIFRFVPSHSLFAFPLFATALRQRLAFDQTLRPKDETSWAKLAKEARDLFHPDFHNVSTATICNSHATQYNKMQESIRKLKHSWGRFYGVSCFPAHPNLLDFFSRRSVHESNSGIERFRQGTLRKSTLGWLGVLKHRCMITWA